MRLFFDRDLGTGVPQALKLVSYADVDWLQRRYAHQSDQGQFVSDVEWLELVGNQGLLAISENKRMLDVAHERAAIVEHRVGIIFIDAAKLRAETILLFMLRRKEWLQNVNHEERPFAYLARMRGKPQRVLPVQ